MEEPPIIPRQTGMQEALPVYITGSRVADLSPLGYRQIALPANEAVHVNGIPSGSVLALVRAEAAGFRYRDDGVDPTPAVGMPVQAGESMVYDAQMTDIRVCAQSSGAIVNISFYGDASDA